MSNLVTGVGTKFKKWVNSAWTDIAEVKQIQGPQPTREVIETTSLDAVDGYKRFIAGFRDGGTLTLNMNFTREGYDMFKADFESDLTQNYEIVLPDVDQTAVEFEGLVTECPLNITGTEAITMEVKIKITGNIAVSSGGSASPA